MLAKPSAHIAQIGPSHGKQRERKTDWQARCASAVRADQHMLAEIIRQAGPGIGNGGIESHDAAPSRMSVLSRLGLFARHVHQPAHDCHSAD